ncbi:MAG: MerR family transcriptional regulator [Desulfovibrionaceae bacterium]
MREKTYRIGEAADMLHLKSYVLRFWETEFPQLAPLRTDKGQRLYTDHHIALLQRIRQLLHEQGMTIEGARRVLVSDSQPASPPFSTQEIPERALPAVDPAPCAGDTGAESALPKGLQNNRAVVREMRAELLALRHMLTTDD